MTKISDLSQDVLYNLGNRADLSTGTPSRIDKWIWDAYLDLGKAYPFEELEKTKDDAFVGNVDTYNYPVDARAIITISYTTASGSQQPVIRRHIRILRRYSSVAPGPPAIYAPFGRQILVRPVPDQFYNFKWDYWQLPQAAGVLADTVVLLPEEWIKDVLVYEATMRGHAQLFERDKAAELRQLLYGDPEDPTNPGMIKRKLLTRAAENVDSDFAIRPRKRNYSFQ
jgi:hypothetical protein